MIFVDLPAELFKAGSRYSWRVMFCLLNVLTFLKFPNETNWMNVNFLFMTFYIFTLSIKFSAVGKVASIILFPFPFSPPSPFPFPLPFLFPFSPPPSLVAPATQATYFLHCRLSLVPSLLRWFRMWRHRQACRFRFLVTRIAQTGLGTRLLPVDMKDEYLIPGSGLESVAKIEYFLSEIE